MAALHVQILTTERTVYDDTVDEITLPTESGQIGIFANHVPLISIVKTGEMLVRKGTTTVPFAIHGGIVEVRPGSEIIILADDTEHAHDIEIEEAEKAYARAQEAMKNKEMLLDTDFAKFEIELLRELNRLKIARKWQQ